MLGKRLDYQVEENKIHFFFEKEEAFLEVITESIMNVFVPYETKGHRSKAIEGEKAVRTDFEVKDCSLGGLFGGDFLGMGLGGFDA